MQFTLKRAFALGAVATLGLVGTAQAATDTTTATLDPGTATMIAPTFSDFTNTVLNGSSQTKTTAATNWSANDARGNGLGWEVTMAASELSTGGTAPVVMTGATLKLAAPTVAPTDATNTSVKPAVLGGDLRAGTVKVADANANEGLGEFAFTQSATALSLGIPANARAGIYTSTITTTFTPGV